AGSRPSAGSRPDPAARSPVDTTPRRSRGRIIPACDRAGRRRIVGPPRRRGRIHVHTQGREAAMAKKGSGEGVYRVIDVIGTSKRSWEAATKNAVETAT